MFNHLDQPVRGEPGGFRNSLPKPRRLVGASGFFIVPFADCASCSISLSYFPHTPLEPTSCNLISVACSSSSFSLFPRQPSRGAKTSLCRNSTVPAHSPDESLAVLVFSTT